MRSLFLFFLVLFLSLMGIAQGTIYCELVNHPSDEKLKFAYFMKAGNSKIDIKEIVKGRVTFTFYKQVDSLIEYGIIYISKYPNQKLVDLAKEGYRYDFVLENEDLTIYIDNFQKKMEVNGGLENKIFKRIEELYKKVNGQSYDNNQQVAKAYLSLSYSLFDLIEKYPTIQVLYPYFKNIFEYFYKYDKSQIVKVEGLYERMPQSFKNSKWSKEYYSAIFENNRQYILPNKMDNFLPNIELFDKNGKRTMLYDHKSRLVLIDFWATWCRSCLLDKSDLNILQNAYGGNNFSIVGIALDKKEEVWRSKIHKLTNNSINEYWTRSKNELIAKIRKFPTYILVDIDEKKILKWDLRIEDIESEIKKYLK